jgi:hypothetical protein
VGHMTAEEFAPATRRWLAAVRRRPEYSVTYIASLILLISTAFVIPTHVRATALMYRSAIVLSVLDRYFPIGWSRGQHVSKS